MSSYEYFHDAPMPGSFSNGTEPLYEQRTTLYEHEIVLPSSFTRVEGASSMRRFYSPQNVHYGRIPNQKQSRSVHSPNVYYPLPSNNAVAMKRDRGVFKPAIDPDTADAAAALVALPKSLGSKKSCNLRSEKSAFCQVTGNDAHCPPSAISPQSVATNQFPAPSCFQRLRPTVSSDCSTGSDSSTEETSSLSNKNENNARDEGEAAEPQTSRQVGEWFSGCTLLALPEDDDVLSPLHCFMRKYCVEAFSAEAEDVALPRYGRGYGCKIQVGQVGIRCLHCRWRKPQIRAERAVCYPSSIKNIYHSMETWQRRHSIVCEDIPGWVKKRLTELMKLSRSFAGGRRQYWTDAGMKLGLVDTKHGVRFSIPPSDRTTNYQRPLSCASPQTPPKRALLAEEDRHLVTKYLFLLMEQMQLCHFTEEDRTGGRSKVKDNTKVGFPGLECKHCRGKAGFGRYFPNSLDNLALANSDRNIYNHMIKCRRCPQEVKSALRRSHRGRCIEEGSKNRRGSRRKFFDRIWNRLHGETLLCSLVKDDENERP
eukprot:CAMPEP_0185728234 /NCGR_PEP_ID=MMETSP1171-20130828/3652_1 /TAXON_ID=374046 /ORGANISM="Helicotheca tamensis, Strain CCMP826" /LENGTH=537 /DNA_ID=CAMNT_0028396917 /DNA_START=142 /DNA_END=1755 /DNA_ORIENTATION=-